MVTNEYCMKLWVRQCIFHVGQKLVFSMTSCKSRIWKDRVTNGLVILIRNDKYKLQFCYNATNDASLENLSSKQLNSLPASDFC